LPGLILLWLGLIIYLPYFKITKITYQGLKLVKKEEIENYLLNSVIGKSRIIPLNNYFLISTPKITQKLGEQFAFSSIKISKIFPNELKVVMEEKISAVVYDNGQQYFLMDEDGTVLKYLAEVGWGMSTIGVFPAVSSTIAQTTSSSLAASTTSSLIEKTHVPDYRKIAREFGNYSIIFDERSVSTTEKRANLIPSPIIKAVINWDLLLKQRGIAIAKYFALGNPGAGVTIHTDFPWKIYFQPTNDTEIQLNNLKLILKDNYPKEYVDLRFGERVYWK